VICLAAIMSISALAQENVVRIGIIGLDTSHSVRFSQVLNDKNSNDPNVLKYEVVAAYPYGTQDIPSAARRINGYTNEKGKFIEGYVTEIQRYGVEVVNSIEELLGKVDCVFIETNDGRMHLDQAAQVFKSGKKCYIDKPLGSTLAEAIAIYKLADIYNRPVFSSSTLRFSKVTADIHDGVYGKVKGADVYSPHHPESALDANGKQTHPDFGYYGIHGVEILFTVMGTGCEYVNRIHGKHGDIVSAVWNDGRLGSFRAITTNPNIYGGTVILEKPYEKSWTVQAGGYDGYKPLLDAVLKFFETDIAPVSKAETLEMFAFMEASNISLKQGGKTVAIADVYAKAEKEAQKLVKPYLK